MTRINTAYIAVDISVSGKGCEYEAAVDYIYCRAYGAIYDGSGPVSPPEPETAEIQRVLVTGTDPKGQRKPYDILPLLTDDQVSAIENDILEQRA